jgi:ferrous iron transport protein B
MGLTASSTGKSLLPLRSPKASTENRVIALAGNPNVGKSTVFNGLTGMKQHTGNWPGKTVATAVGVCHGRDCDYTLVDLPGTYSLFAHSPEEEVARDFLCLESPDAVIVVCDATSLERNLNLVLQIMEVSGRVILCLNLMDEAKRKHIHISIPVLSRELGIPVVAISARKKQDLSRLTDRLDFGFSRTPLPPHSIRYPTPIEDAIRVIENSLDKVDLCGLSSRWLALRLLDSDEGLRTGLTERLGEDFFQNPKIKEATILAEQSLIQAGYHKEGLEHALVSALIASAEQIAKRAVTVSSHTYGERERRFDRILTGKRTAYPIMLLFLLLIFFLTVSVSNIPSAWLSRMFFLLEQGFSKLLISLRAPPWLHDLLTEGVLRTLGWVISVMLPPMAIFFPLFTILEDAGFLPRIAYNLDRPFCRCHACGKQALTMCMGFGCNAAGVIGCRIIDSKRERLLAILTNSLVPCNGRFPALIAILSMFVIGTSSNLLSSLEVALLLTLLILLSIFATLTATHLLSVTALRGIPSSFTLELPPFRRPQFSQVIIRSVFDRTLFVLGRAAAVAAPAGLIIWIMANVTVGELSLLSHGAAFLDPFASLLGMDGIILIAFILGFPANEIVIPIILMGYLSTGSLTELSGLSQMREVLVANGWTSATAVSVLLFFLFHWPCSTTLATVKKETGSWRWTLLAAILPTAIGMLACMIWTVAVRILV